MINFDDTKELRCYRRKNKRGQSKLTITSVLSMQNADN